MLQGKIPVRANTTRLAALSAAFLLSACPCADGSSLAGVGAGLSTAEAQSIESSSATIDPASVTMFERGEYLVGVGTHFGAGRDLGYDPARGIEALNAANMNSYREDIYWQAFSPTGSPREARMNPKLATVLETARQRPVLILTGGHRKINDAYPPTSDAARAAFADFAVRAVGATIDKSPIYEIWNEWNRTADMDLGAFDDEGKEGDPRFSGTYAQLVRATVPAIKSAYPEAKVLIGGAATDWKWNWLLGVVKRSGLGKADGLSVHLYNQCFRQIRGADEMISRLQTLQRGARGYNGNRDVPIYVTEWGWSTAKTCGVPNDFVVANTSQFMFAAAAIPWIRGTWQYELKDEGRDPAKLIDNFGILDFNYADKPVSCAARESAAILRSVRSIGAAPRANGVQVIFARNAKENLAIAWNPQGIGKSLVIEGGGPYTVEPICRAERTVKGGQPIALSATPVVLHLGSTAKKLSIRNQ